MSFMQPQIEFGQYFAVETNQGTFIVPADVIGSNKSIAAGVFTDYVEGTIPDDDELIEIKEGWLARLSAPGYMDCTDWSVFDTEEEAVQGLKDLYEDDDEGEDE